eukprot:3654338-Prymnesium_polylepis.1
MHAPPPHACMWHKCPGGWAGKRSPAVKRQSFDVVTMTLELTLRLPTMFDSRGSLACKYRVEVLHSLVERARHLVSGVDVPLVLALLYS